VAARGQFLPVADRHHAVAGAITYCSAGEPPARFARQTGMTDANLKSIARQIKLLAAVLSDTGDDVSNLTARTQQVDGKAQRALQMMRKIRDELERLEKGFRLSGF